MKEKNTVGTDGNATEVPQPSPDAEPTCAVVKFADMSEGMYPMSLFSLLILNSEMQ